MCNKNLWVRVWLSIQAKDWPVPAQEDLDVLLLQVLEIDWEVLYLQ